MKLGDFLALAEQAVDVDALLLEASPCLSCLLALAFREEAGIVAFLEILDPSQDTEVDQLIRVELFVGILELGLRLELLPRDGARFRLGFQRPRGRRCDEEPQG